MELKKCLKFRNLWVGIAMLWIFFFHSALELTSEGLVMFKNFGYGGVDICLFASGIGCYLSLEKDPDILEFLKRRVKRLGPVYLCFIVPWILWRLWISDMPGWAILGNLLGVQSLVSWDYHFNWYIGGLVVYYFTMPYMKRLTDSRGKLWQDLLVWLCIAVATIPFWGDQNNIVLLSRLPVVYSGMVFGKLIKDGYVLRVRDYLVSGLAVAAGAAVLVLCQTRAPGLLWNQGLYWYPFALIAPGCCVLISGLAEKLEGYKIFRFLRKLLELVGIYSFELYLIHVFVYEDFRMVILDYLWRITVNGQWLMSIPVILVGIFLLNRVAALLSRLVFRK